MRVFSCLLIYLLLSGEAFSQDEAARAVIRLQHRLPALKGQERIACLNDIAQRMLYTSYEKWDSSLWYSKLAMKEAKEIGYMRGLARGNIIHGDGLLQYQRSKEGEKYFKEAIKIARENKLEGLLTMGIRRLGQALWYQGRFTEAIENIRATIPYFEKRSKGDNFFQLINCYTSIANIYNDWGNYEKGFEYIQQGLALSKQKNDTDNIIQCYSMIGSLYAGVGDHKTAFEYYHIASTYLRDCDDCYPKRFLNMVKGNLYRVIGNYDSSMYYLLKTYKGNPTSTLTKLYIAETLLKQQRLDTALSILLDLKKFHGGSGDGARTWQLNAAIGTAYFMLKQYDRAIQFTSNGLHESYQKGLRGEYVLDAFKLMSSVYKLKGNTDSALFYFEHYARMKDSVISDQLKGKLFEYKRIAEDEKKQAQIELLKQQKAISEQQLSFQRKQARQNLFMKNVLIGAILLLLITSFFILRYISLKRRNERLKNQQLQSQLQHKAAELEMQALRAQMNPHFIFNCLSSINRFILKNETEAASDYLTRFSRLIRLVLIHSQSSTILLKDEIEMLRLYLDMEQLRFKNSFDYELVFANSIDPETIFIPPLLLQPFCENAIWHGLMHKEGYGHLEIKMNMQHGLLNCTITDNGIGRTKAAEFRTRSGERQRSLGLKITAERLALINQDKGLNTSFVIEDVLNDKNEVAGTRVILNILYKEEQFEKQKQFNVVV